MSSNVSVMSESMNEMIHEMSHIFSGFMAQLVRASYQQGKVMGSNPSEVLNFSGFSTQLLKLHL